MPRLQDWQCLPAGLSVGLGQTELSQRLLDGFQFKFTANFSQQSEDESPQQ